MSDKLKSQYRNKQNLFQKDKLLTQEEINRALNERDDNLFEKFKAWIISQKTYEYLSNKWGPVQGS